MAKKWAGGYIDPVSNYYFIRKRLRSGRRAHFSTGWKAPNDRDGAEAVWRDFKADPDGYLGRLAEAKAGRGPQALKPPAARSESLDDAAIQFVHSSQYEEGNGLKHVTQQAATLVFFKRFLFDHSLPAVVSMVTLANVKSFVAWRRQGWNRAKRDEQGKLVSGATPGKPAGEHSIANDLVTMKRFAKWLVFTDRIPTNPLRWDRDRETGLPTPKRPKNSRRLKVIADEAWERVKAAGLLDKWCALGDVLLDTGVRYASIARMEQSDIDEQQAIITFPGNKMKGRIGKTKRVSRVALAKAALVVAAKIPPDASDFDRALARACTKARVPRFSAHTFRSTFASRMLAAGFSLKEIQSELMHESLATTERYVHLLSANDSGFSAYLRDEPSDS